MRRFMLILVLTLTLPACARGGGGGGGAGAGDDDDAGDGSQVTLVTSMGEITISVFVDDAPITAENFLQYVDDGFFDGSDDNGATTFHRVIDAFMVQGGGFLANGTRKTTRDPIVNEASSSGLSNERGTLAMARTDDPDSATSQFFINVVDNGFLDPGDGAGYAVFGEVTSGMDVADAISLVARNDVDEPLDPITIESMTRQ
jgi:cyclophilin family peptidyl-prolyl cis-trans isomerase